MDIEIHLNGERKNVPDGLSVADLVKSLNLVPERIAIEFNLQILKRENWEKKLISRGDRIEIVHFVGGGSWECGHLPRKASSERGGRAPREYSS